MHSGVRVIGILWPKSNVQITTNSSGTPRVAAGAKIYFFEAGTTTPRTSYQDADLTTPHTHPVIADAYGRAPAIFLDFGDYRERVNTSGGTNLWDTDDIPNAAPVEPESGLTEDSFQALQTGQIIFALANESFNGFVRCNGRTIGSATSGASERANSDCEDLFLYLWNKSTTLRATMAAGAGANAAADWAANKTFPLPDGRSAGMIGFDDMGNSAASLAGSAPVVSGSAILAGSIIGANTHTLTEAQIAAHTHSFSATSSSDGAHTHTATTSSDGAHTHTVTIASGQGSHTHGVGGGAQQFVTFSGGLGGAGTAAGSTQTVLPATDAATLPQMTGSADSQGAHTHTLTTSSNGAHTHTISGTSGSTGGGTAHNNLARSLPVTVLMKL